jgi:hypothetical protein
MNKYYIYRKSDFTFLFFLQCSGFRLKYGNNANIFYRYCHLSYDMQEEINNLVIGVIFLILIINTMMLMSLVTALNGPAAGQSVPFSPAISFPVFASSADAVTPEPVYRIPTIVPLVNQGAALPDTSVIVSGKETGPDYLVPTIVPLVNQGAALPDTSVIVSGKETEPVIKTISSYVTIEPKEAPKIENHTFIQSVTPGKYDTGYVPIYSLTSEELSQVLPLVSFSLLNPPLVIDYDIVPASTTDIKYIEYKELSTLHEENLVITRPFEDTWFTLIVRNKDTGQIVAEDGFGRTYSFQSPRQLVLRESGNYSFEFTGDYGVINLTMKVKQEGNFP